MTEQAFGTYVEAGTPPRLSHQQLIAAQAETPAEQQRRERLQLAAAGRFARGDTIREIARDLRVTEGSVQRRLGR